MAQFTNFATLTYTGGATNSNTVTGEIQEVLTLTKEAATAAYAANGRIPYVLSLGEQRHRRHHQPDAH